MQKLFNYYRQLLDDNREWLKISAAWFILAALVGSAMVFIKPDLLASIIAGFRDRFGDSPALDMNLAWQIFLQNLTASAVALFGGFFLGLGAVFVVGINGFILGFVVTSILISVASLPAALILIFGGIVPHGILELSAFFLAGAIGLRLGTQWLGHASAGQRWPVLKQNWKQAVLFFPLITIVLFLAALVEVFISGRIVGN